MKKTHNIQIKVGKCIKYILDNFIKKQFPLELSYDGQMEIINSIHLNFFGFACSLLVHGVKMWKLSKFYKRQNSVQIIGIQETQYGNLLVEGLVWYVSKIY